MHRLWDAIIAPLARAAAPRVIVEIGADNGHNTENILKFCEATGAVAHIVDPLPKFDVEAAQARWGERFVFHKALSLNALPQIEAPDLVLIDGDHNWWTVHAELTLLARAARTSGRRFPLVLLHDVGWPYGRRDLYYDPEVIPLAYRHPFQQAGMLPGQGALAGKEGLNPHLRNAIYENALKNGVLTAVEDFIAAHEAEGFAVRIVPAFHGLGVLTRTADESEALKTAIAALPTEGPAAAALAMIEAARVQTEIERQTLHRKRKADAVEHERVRGLLNEEIAGQAEAFAAERAAHARELAGLRAGAETVQTARREESARLRAALEEAAARHAQELDALNARLEAEQAARRSEKEAAARFVEQALAGARAETESALRAASVERDVLAAERNAARVALAETKESAEAERTHARESAERVAAEIAALNRALAQAEAALVERDAGAGEIEALTRSLQQAQDALAESAARVHALETHQAAYAEKLQDAEGRAEAAAADLAAVCAEVDALRTQAARAESEAAAALKEERARRTDAEGRFVGAQAALAAAGQESAAQIEAAQEERARLAAANAELRNAQTAAAERVSRLEAEARKRDALIGGLKADLHHAKSVVAQKDQQKQAFEARVAALAGERAALRERLQRFERSIIARAERAARARAIKLASRLAGLGAAGRGLLWRTHAALNPEAMRLQAGIVRAAAAFDAEYYLAANPDVRRAGIDPALHYVRHGWIEGRSPSPHFHLFARAHERTNPVLRWLSEGAPALNPADTSPASPNAALPLSRSAARSADIVVPIHNSPDDVRLCLAALDRWRRPKDRLILIDDGSAEETRALVAQFAARNPRDLHFVNAEAGGYTRAINKGIAASSADYVILLNSDAIVTPDWVEKLIAAAESDERIGIVGPLSNAASWQSAPERFGPAGDWMVNALPKGFDPVLMSRIAESAPLAARAAPVPLVNGFCFAIKRALLDKIGAFDEARFPQGYGEETDFCFRAADAGFNAAIALDAYVFHAKSKSFTHERRRVLSKAGNGVLEEAYGKARILAATDALRHDEHLAAARTHMGETLRAIETGALPSILFLLPCSAGGGGVHSIIQEARGLAELGADVRVAVRANHLASYEALYAGADRAQIVSYREVQELRDRAAEADVCVATIHSSIALLADLAARLPGMAPFYYVQDYEPFFYDEADPQRRIAEDSYSLVPNATLFAKTNWLCSTVEARHGVPVRRVQASIDRSIYRPGPRAADGKVRIAAMVRPRTPRRGAARTLNVLAALAGEYGARVALDVFGAGPEEIVAAGLACDPHIAVHGKLAREGVADLLRAADVFVDLSDYQAFGRTALEAMACGATAIVPQEGGAHEFARHGKNALVIDTQSERAAIEALRGLIEDAPLRERLRAAALETAQAYSIERAALSELALFLARAPARTKFERAFRSPQSMNGAG
ncbi:MAG: glycosyltransferase [Hyphomonadaceae bacterium]